MILYCAWGRGGGGGLTQVSGELMIYVWQFTVFKSIVPEQQ